MEPRQNSNEKPVPQRTRFTTFAMERPSLQPYLSGVKPGIQSYESETSIYTHNINDLLHRLALMRRQNKDCGQIKPDQKSFLSAMSAFLSALDLAEQDVPFEVQLEDIPEIFAKLKYSGNINKSMFSPIGARHTWVQCLQLLNWLAQLVNYKILIQETWKAKKITQDEELENAFILGFMNDSEELAIQEVEEIVRKRQQTNNARFCDLEYNRENMQMAINNLNNIQKDLESLRTDLRITEAVQFRQTQYLTSASQDVEQLERKIELAREKLNEGRIVKLEAENRLKNLQDRINKQEFSTSEVKKIELEIKEMEAKIKKLREESDKKSLQYELAKRNLLGKFNEYKTLFQMRSEIIYQHMPILSKYGTLSCATLNDEKSRQYLNDNTPAQSELVESIIDPSIKKLIQDLKNIGNRAQQQKLRLTHTVRTIELKVRESKQNSQTRLTHLNLLKGKRIEAERKGQEILEQLRDSNLKLITLQGQNNVLDEKIMGKQEQFISYIPKISQLHDRCLVLKQELMRSEKRWQLKWQELIALAKDSKERMEEGLRIHFHIHKEANLILKEKVKKWNHRQPK